MPEDAKIEALGAAKEKFEVAGLHSVRSEVKAGSSHPATNRG
jgi:hypothetical protein